MAIQPFGQQEHARINTDLLADIRDELEMRLDESAVLAASKIETVAARFKAVNTRCKQFIAEIDQILPREPDADGEDDHPCQSDEQKAEETNPSRQTNPSQSPSPEQIGATMGEIASAARTEMARPKFHFQRRH